MSAKSARAESDKVPDYFTPITTSITCTVVDCCEPEYIFIIIFLFILSMDSL